MNAFSKEYDKFIKQLCSYLKDPSESVKKFHQDVDKDFIAKIDEIENEAKSEYAQTAIEFASSQIDPSLRDRLLMEMKLFNALSDPAKKTDDEEEYNKEYKYVLNAGESVKGSLEEFLKQWLPEWLQKALKILNQIISIMKG